MNFLDFFAGIGAFRLGLERAGMSCVGACEIADFQRAVYATRFGHAPTFDDVTKIAPEELPAADLWCGGWPCQGLSSAGLRKGIFQDPRSNLIWTLLDLADDAESLGRGPTWLLLENVPGILNGRDWSCGDEVHGGGAEDPCPTCRRPLGDAAAGHVPVPWLGAVLGAMADRGWVGAWRVLDAQFFGVAQHRERVFFLARRAGAAGPSPSEVLLEPSSVRGDPPACRAAGEAVAGTVTSGSTGGRGYSADDAGGGRLVVGPIVAGGRGRTHAGGGSGEHGGLVVDVPCAPQEAFSIYPEGGQGADLVATAIDVSPAITVTDGVKQTDRGVRVVVGTEHTIAFDRAQVTSPDNRSRLDPDRAAPSIAAQGQVHVAAYSVFSEGSDAVKDAAKETDHARTLDRNGGFAAGQGGTVVNVTPYAITPQGHRQGEGFGGFADAGLSVSEVEAATTIDRAAGSTRIVVEGAGPDTAHPIATRPRNTSHGPDTYVLPLDVRNSTRDAAGGAGSAGMGVGQPGQAAFTVTRSAQGVFAYAGVRRLLPRECERLFGLPDDWTAIEGATDSRRYEALGNSVAEPVVFWIGRRLVEACGPVGPGLVRHGEVG